MNMVSLFDVFWIFVNTFHKIWKTFSHYFFKYSLSFTFSFFLELQFQVRQIIVSHRSLMFCSPFSLLFLCFILDSFHYNVFKFSNLVFHQCLISPIPLWVFFTLILYIFFLFLEDPFDSLWFFISHISLLITVIFSFMFVDLTE